MTVRKKQVNVTFIPEGATDNTWVGHWMNGSYSTLVRSDNQNYWELSMTLHVPSFTPGYIYMLWHQMVNPYLTAKKNDFTDYYESYACSVVHSPLAITSSANGTTPID